MAAIIRHIAHPSGGWTVSCCVIRIDHTLSDTDVEICTDVIYEAFNRSE
jgi:hypothetical protein